MRLSLNSLVYAGLAGASHPLARAANASSHSRNRVVLSLGEAILSRAPSMHPWPANTRHLDCSAVYETGRSSHLHDLAPTTAPRPRDWGGGEHKLGHTGACGLYFFFRAQVKYHSGDLPRLIWGYVGESKTAASCGRLGPPPSHESRRPGSGSSANGGSADAEDPTAPAGSPSPRLDLQTHGPPGVSG
jgi:hypothetical protein